MVQPALLSMQTELPEVAAEASCEVAAIAPAPIANEPRVVTPATAKEEKIFARLDALRFS